jgi:hypothetical protein
MTTGLWTAALLGGLLPSLVPISPAWADDINKEKKPALVVVIAKAVGDVGSGCVGCPLSARATGFFVDSFGTVVSSYHVMSTLGTHITSDGVSFSVITGDVIASQQRPASLEYFDAIHDILVLKVPGDWDDVPYFRSAKRPHDVALTGIIKAMNGPPPLSYLWVTDMQFEDAQSGSPVYLEDGSLLGIVKGTEKLFPKNDFFVPVEYLENLIPAVLKTATTSAPQQTGQLQISAAVFTKRTNTVQRVRDVSFSNPPCAPRQLNTIHVAAENGAQIDPTSVVLVDEAKSGSTAVVQNVRSNGFDVSVDLFSQGKCLTVFGKKVANDLPANFSGTVRWAETYQDNIGKLIPIARVQALPGSTVDTRLPAGVRPSQISVSYIDPKGENIRLGGVGELDGLKASVTQSVLGVSVPPM